MTLFLGRSDIFWNRVVHIIDTFPDDDAFLAAIERDDVIARARKDALRARIARDKRELEGLERR